MASSIRSAAGVCALAAALLLPRGIQAKPLPQAQETAGLPAAPSAEGATAPAKPEPAAGPPAGQAVDFRPPAVGERGARGARRAWVALALAQHGAAAFDAYTTREAIGEGRRELDPLARPFAHSAAIYPVMQGESALIDFLGRRMMRSRIGWVRRVWWLPQTVSTAGFVWSGVHNARLPRR